MTLDSHCPSHLCTSTSAVHDTCTLRLEWVKVISLIMVSRTGISWQLSSAAAECRVRVKVKVSSKVKVKHSTDEPCRGSTRLSSKRPIPATSSSRSLFDNDVDEDNYYDDNGDYEDDDDDDDDDDDCGDNK